MMVTPELLYRFMRVVPWATPRRVRRLTDRQIWRLCAAQDDDGESPEGAPRDEPPAPPKGSLEEYQGWRVAASMMGMTEEAAVAEWEKKRGPVPTA